MTTAVFLNQQPSTLLHRLMAVLKFFLFIFSLSMLISTDVAAKAKIPERIRIQDLEKHNDPIASYVVEILALAIKKSGGPYIIEKLAEELDSTGAANFRNVAQSRSARRHLDHDQ